MQKTIKNGWRVHVRDEVVNTGLDSAVFPTKKQATEARRVLAGNEDYGAGSFVARANCEANTTFSDWNSAGW